MIKLKNILEQRGNERPINILFITDYDINHNWHVFRRLLRYKNITGIFKSYKDEDSSEMVNLLHYNISKIYDFVILQLSNLNDDNVNIAIQNYKRAIRICNEIDIPLIIIAPPYPKFARDLEQDKNLIYFERIDAWLHSRETADVMMVDLSGIDDDEYFTKDGLKLNKTGNDIIYNEILNLIINHSQEIEEPEELIIEPEDEPEKPKPVISLKKLLDGHVEIIGPVTSEQETNIKTIIQYLEEYGIVDPYHQIGILSVIGKETGFIPQTEIGYSDTPNDHIRDVFGSRVPADDAALDRLKANDEEFFNHVYGGRLGNQPVPSDDGYVYRGRGYNQLTGKKNYQIYSALLGKNFVADPDLVNEPENAGPIAAQFMLKGKSANSLPKFDNIPDAVTYFTNLNGGGSADARNHARARRTSKLFKIVP